MAFTAETVSGTPIVLASATALTMLTSVAAEPVVAAIDRRRDQPKRRGPGVLAAQVCEGGPKQHGVGRAGVDREHDAGDEEAAGGPAGVRGQQPAEAEEQDVELEDRRRHPRHCHQPAQGKTDGAAERARCDDAVEPGEGHADRERADDGDEAQRKREGGAARADAPG